MKKNIQNKLGTYLAVTAGVGCAASTAEGAIVVVDLSGVSTTTAQFITIPTLDGLADVLWDSYQNTYGFLQNLPGGSSRFYSDGGGINGNVTVGRGYAATAIAGFPSDGDYFVLWAIGVNTIGSGFAIGENWVAFKESSGKFGWMSFTLNSLGVNSTLPISSFGHFVYDDTSTGPGDAITLQAAVAAAAIPEPSSLVLLALGASGLAARRQRKKAA